MRKLGFSIMAAALTASAAARPQLPEQLSWPTFAYPVVVEQVSPQGVYVEAPGDRDVILPPGLVYQMAGEPILTSSLRAGHQCEVVMPAGQGQLLNFDGSMATVVSPYGIAPIPIQYLPPSHVPPAWLHNPAAYQQPQQQPVYAPEPYYPDPYYQDSYAYQQPISTGYLYDTRPVRPVTGFSAGDFQMNLGETNPMYAPYYGGSDSWSLGFNPLNNSLSVAAPSNTFNPMPWAVPALALAAPMLWSQTAPVMWSQPAPMFVQPQPVYQAQHVQQFWNAPPVHAPWQRGRKLGWHKQQQKFSYNSWQPQAAPTWAVAPPTQWQRPHLNWSGAQPQWNPRGRSTERQQVRYGGGSQKRQWSGNGGQKRQWSSNGGGQKRQWSNNGGGQKPQWSNNGGGQKRQWSNNGGGQKRQWSGGGGQRQQVRYGGGGGRSYSGGGGKRNFSGGGGGGRQRGGGGGGGKRGK